MPTNYLGVAGSSDSNPSGTPSSAFMLDGTFFVASSVRERDFTDGMSNTLVVGERGVPTDHFWGWALCGASTQDAYISLQRGIAPGTASSGASLVYFWSHHPGGVQFLFGDGSARMMSYSTDFNLLKALSTRAGNEVIGEF